MSNQQMQYLVNLASSGLDFLLLWIDMLSHSLYRFRSGAVAAFAFIEERVSNYSLLSH